MKNEIEAMITDITTTTAEAEDYTQARTGFYTAASAIRQKKPTFQKKPPNG